MVWESYVMQKNALGHHVGLLEGKEMQLERQNYNLVELRKTVALRGGLHLLGEAGLVGLEGEPLASLHLCQGLGLEGQHCAACQQARQNQTQRWNQRSRLAPQEGHK